MKSKSRFDLWTPLALGLLGLYAIFLIFPLINLFGQAIIDEKTGQFTLSNFIKFFSTPYYFNTLLNSFKVTFAVTISTLILATPLAYIFTRFEIRGKETLRVLIIIASMSAPFVGAYSWILLLGRSGVITLFLKNYLGIAFPSIYGFSGIILVLTLELYPMIFLYVSGALKNVDNSLLEASENLGCSGVKRFFKIIIPLIAPTLFAGGLLVFMRALADFGTPMLIGEGYRTFPITIFIEYINEIGGNKRFAAAISIIAIIITTFIFLVQRYFSTRKSFSINSMNKIRPVEAKGITRILIHIYTYLLVGLSTMPHIYIFYTSFRNVKGLAFAPGYYLQNYIDAFEKVGKAISNTMIIPATSLVIVIFLAVLIAYISVRRSGPIASILDSISMIPYVLPGSVIGITLLLAFNKPPIILSGTMIIMVVSLAVRRMPYTIRSTAAILQQIPMNIEEAAQSLGSSKIKTFYKITIPMMVAGIISGAILTWITMISELSSSIILYTARTRTLTIEIYTQIIRGNYGIATALATILTILTVISLIIFNKVSKEEELTM
ncbi:MAG: iron ABC transporter permease [Anaerolineaceae bacterium]|nr:iron ABC transporter permease [Anaerolineaceae bacterium]